MVTVFIVTVIALELLAAGVRWSENNRVGAAFDGSLALAGVVALLCHLGAL